MHVVPIILGIIQIIIVIVQLLCSATLQQTRYSVECNAVIFDYTFSFGPTIIAILPHFQSWITHINRNRTVINNCNASIGTTFSYFIRNSYSRRPLKTVIVEIFTAYIITDDMLSLLQCFGFYLKISINALIFNHSDKF